MQMNLTLRTHLQTPLRTALLACAAAFVSFSAFAQFGMAQPAAAPAAAPNFLGAVPTALLARPDALAAPTDPTRAANPARPAKIQVPSQFQRFVQEGTGKLLPHFGSELFENPQAYTADNAAPAPADYALSVGDEVRVQIWGAVDYSGSHTIDRNGQISLPKIGTFALAGTQVKDLETVLRKQVATVFTNITLNANLGRLRGITVYVVGHAQQPGTYTLSSLSTLVNALFASGGPSTNGSMRNIQIKRAGKTVTTFDLYEFISKGDKTRDVSLQAGDVITIPPAGPRVAVTGAWDHSAIYELIAGSTVQDLLALGGGLPALAAPQKALVERIDNTQTPSRQVQEIALSGPGLQHALRDGDVLTLLRTSPQFSNAVTLRGNVADPLRFSYKAGMRISDLIPEPQALIQRDYFSKKNNMVQSQVLDKISTERSLNEVKNLLEEINWDYASIERLDAKEVKTVLIPFNLGKAIKNKDPAHNLTLLPGDVVTVFGVTDLPVPVGKRTQFVRVGGEVQQPGFYQITAGETLPQLLQRAGGLTSEAFSYGTVFSRETTRKEQQANLDRAIRKMEQDISSQTVSQLQNVTDAEKGNNVQAQIAGQRILLGRMQSLKSSGRIALEISANNPEFPPISLEDGDTILVPNRPSFVGVFGAVHSETSFIYKSSNNVRAYLDKAGPTRDADVDSAFIIRADGTVQANKSGGSWVGLGSSSFMSAPVFPGDSIFVPEVLDRRNAYTQFIQGAKDWTQLLYQFGLSAVAIKTLRQ
jgi:protein involved in polysaccharide export with SLBB domain